MFTKVKNFLVRVLLRLLLSLHLDEWVAFTLRSFLLHYSFSCSPTLSDVISANSLQEHFEKVNKLANGFRASVYSSFGDLPEPCEIEISFPKGLTSPVHIYSRGYCRVSFPGLSAEFHDLLPRDSFSISFYDSDKE